jgi:hypothetical protein
MYHGERADREAALRLQVPRDRTRQAPQAVRHLRTTGHADAEARRSVLTTLACATLVTVRSHPPGAAVGGRLGHGSRVGWWEKTAVPVPKHGTTDRERPHLLKLSTHCPGPSPLSEVE